MDSRVRRKVLKLTSVGFSAALAGCFVETSHQPTATGSRKPTESEVPEEINPEDHVPGEWHDTPELGTADAAEVRTSIRDDVTYYPDEEKVKIGTGEFRPADEWLRIDCPHAAARHIQKLLKERLADLTNITVGFTPHLFDDKDVVVVRRILILERDGTVARSPTITFDTLQDATPQRIVMTVTLDEFEHTCRVPVYILDTLEKYE